MNLEKALTIDGFMEPLELEWLASQASTRSNICEIGSWQGRSTRAMADNTVGIVHAVDWWQGSPEILWILSKYPAGWLFETFNRNMEGLTNVRTHKMISLEAAASLTETFDMIFIDGEHNNGQCEADILAWLPHLRPGGLLCGHDFHHPPIAEAVKRLLPGYWVPVHTIFAWVEGRKLVEEAR